MSPGVKKPFQILVDFLVSLMQAYCKLHQKLGGCVELQTLAYCLNVDSYNLVDD